MFYNVISCFALIPCTALLVLTSIKEQWRVHVFKGREVLILVSLNFNLHITINATHPYIVILRRTFLTVSIDLMTKQGARMRQ